jgi:soluble lytic murein transglycosylase-like protein
MAYSGPGRAATVSGSSTAGCKVSRADVVPARDRSPDRYVRYDTIITEASRLYAIPEALLRAVIKVESDYDPHVVSCAGARGLMQIMPYEEVSQRIDNVFDPRQNILAGARLLRLNANRYQGDLVRTIAAYHAGAGAVDKYGGVPPYQTTQQYVQLVTRAFAKYRTREVAGTPPPRG